MAKTYTAIVGDQWDVVAKKIYGDELHADYLMANNFALLDQYELDPGTVLNTPDLPDKPIETLPVWRSAS